MKRFSSLSSSRRNFPDISSHRLPVVAVLVIACLLFASNLVVAQKNLYLCDKCGKDMTFAGQPGGCTCVNRTGEKACGEAREFLRSKGKSGGGSCSEAMRYARELGWKSREELEKEAEWRAKGREEKARLEAEKKQRDDDAEAQRKVRDEKFKAQQEAAEADWRAARQKRDDEFKAQRERSKANEAREIAIRQADEAKRKARTAADDAKAQAEERTNQQKRNLEGTQTEEIKAATERIKKNTQDARWPTDALKASANPDTAEAMARGMDAQAREAEEKSNRVLYDGSYEYSRSLRDLASASRDHASALRSLAEDARNAQASARDHTLENTPRADPSPNTYLKNSAETLGTLKSPRELRTIVEATTGNKFPRTLGIGGDDLQKAVDNQDMVDGLAAPLHN